MDNDPELRGLARSVESCEGFAIDTRSDHVASFQALVSHRGWPIECDTFIHR